MCTVSFVPRKNGYSLGMNRDEQRARAEALPPRFVRIGDLNALMPSEPRGGTWIGSNKFHITFALINWYEVTRTVNGTATSRGDIIPHLLESASSDGAASRMGGIDLRRTKPFRLIGVFPGEKKILEWRWDLRRINTLPHPWKTQVWISSGHDEAGAQITRHAEFYRRLKQASLGSADWLRRFHRSHKPECGPYSVCMHREDAATVSYTEVLVQRSQLVMNYLADSPCSRKKFASVIMD